MAGILNGDSGNGWVWGFRILLLVLATALTGVATLSWFTLSRAIESIDRVEERLGHVERTIAGLKGDFLTREEANALHEALEQRHGRMHERDREYFRDYRHDSRGTRP